MFGLTPLGLIHTLISAVAVVSGFYALAKRGAIGVQDKLYIWATVLTCLTSFGIFQHGGFGKPHMLAILTLLALAVATAAATGVLRGWLAPYLATVGFSLTLLFHMIPAITEGATRLPASQPLLAGADDPALAAASGVLFLLFLAGAFLQVRRLRARR